MWPCCCPMKRWSISMSFTVQTLWLFGPANHGRSDAVPTLGIALYWRAMSSIFCLLEANHHVEYITILTPPQAQAMKRGLGGWDIMWRSQGASWCCPVDEETHCGNESLAPAAPADARESRENPTAEPFQNSRAAEKQAKWMAVCCHWLGMVCNVAIDSWNTV